MGKIYTVVFNSEIGADLVTNNERYYFDWSRLEEGKYKCQFTFISAVATAPTFFNVPNLFMDVGQGSNVQIASSNVPSAPGGSVFNATFIGALETKTLTTIAGSTSYYYAGTTTNPPFFIDNKPRNNSVQILIRTNGTNQDTPYIPVPGAYTLTLQLEKMDK